MSESPGLVRSHEITIARAIARVAHSLQLALLQDREVECHAGHRQALPEGGHRVTLMERTGESAEVPGAIRTVRLALQQISGPTSVTLVVTVERRRDGSPPLRVEVASFAPDRHEVAIGAYLARCLEHGLIELA